MKTKRFAALICCLVIGTMGLMLSGCGGEKYADSPYLGTWKATTAEYSGIEIGVPDIIGGDFTMTLEADGTCTVDIAGSEESGEWEPTDKGMKIVEGEDEMEFSATDGALALNYEEVIFTFEKSNKQSDEKSE